MKEKVWIGIDPSLRGTGFVAINEKEEIVNMFRLAPCAKIFKDEELLDHIAFASAGWFVQIIENYDVQGYAMERIAYGGASGSKDKIAAGWWEIRRVLKRSLMDALEDPYKKGISWPPITVACNSWRKDIILKEDRAKNKENPDKLFLKNCPFSKLPEQVRADIEKFVKGQPGHPEHDLCDAYWIACYAKNKG